MTRPTQAQYLAAAKAAEVAFETWRAALSDDSVSPAELRRLDFAASDANAAFHATRAAYGRKA